MNLLELYEPLCLSKGGRLLLELPAEPLPPVLADPDLCRQILTILLDNAVSYALSDKSISTPEDNGLHESSYSTEISDTGQRPQKITLRADSLQGHVVVSVVDHGPGISDKEKLLIFDRFYRNDKSRSSKEHFGLGLSIAASLAEIQGIRLAVEDTEGGGSTFSVKI